MISDWSIAKYPVFQIDFRRHSVTTFLNRIIPLDRNLVRAILLGLAGELARTGTAAGWLSPAKDYLPKRRYYNRGQFERVKTMLELLIIIIIVTLGVCVSYRLMQRLSARAKADNIIIGKRPATEAQINKCITGILRTNNWLLGQSEADHHRVRRLRDMRKEMVSPHG